MSSVSSKKLAATSQNQVILTLEYYNALLQNWEPHHTVGRNLFLTCSAGSISRLWSPAVVPSTTTQQPRLSLGFETLGNSPSAPCTYISEELLLFVLPGPQSHYVWIYTPLHYVYHLYTDQLSLQSWMIGETVRALSAQQQSSLFITTSSTRLISSSFLI